MVLILVMNLGYNLTIMCHMTSLYCIGCSCFKKKKVATNSYFSGLGLNLLSRGFVNILVDNFLLHFIMYRFYRYDKHTQARLISFCQNPVYSDAS